MKRNAAVIHDAVHMAIQIHAVIGLAVVAQLLQRTARWRLGGVQDDVLGDAAQLALGIARAIKGAGILHAKGWLHAQQQARQHKTS